MLELKLTRCSWKDLDSIYILAQALAHYFPRPELYVTAIHELLLNAIEHGNLGVGFEKKTQLLHEGKWYEEIRQRLELEASISKSITITLDNNSTGCELRIADEGHGFAWQDFLRRDYSIERPNGRGLTIALQSPFDYIGFNASGNEVVCRVDHVASIVVSNELTKFFSARRAV